MKKIILVFLLFPAMLFSISVSVSISSLVKELAAEYTSIKSDTPFYSRQTVSIL